LREDEFEERSVPDHPSVQPLEDRSHRVGLLLHQVVDEHHHLRVARLDGIRVELVA
jgi:hypothetical protein